MGFKQVFDNLTVKHMDALRKQIQSLADFVLNHCFWAYVPWVPEPKNNKKKKIRKERKLALVKW